MGGPTRMASPRSLAVMTLPLHRQAARSMVDRSSRTFPGQARSRNLLLASSVMITPRFAEKWAASAPMSSPRSANDGRFRTTPAIL